MHILGFKKYCAFERVVRNHNRVKKKVEKLILRFVGVLVEKMCDRVFGDFLYFRSMLTTAW